MHRERARGSVFEESFLNSGKAGTGEIHASRAASVMDFVGGSRSAATGDALQPVGCFGARNPCADCSTAGRCACPAVYSGLFGAIAPGSDSRGKAPFRALWDRGGLALSRGHNSGAGAACIRAASAPQFAAQPVKIPGPVPLFAAQPTKVFCRGFFSKKPESFLPRLFFSKKPESFLPRLFFQKSGD